jgi:hypothetical protein
MSKKIITAGEKQLQDPSSLPVRSKKGSLSSYLESLVIAAILLVLVQTFLEDFAVISQWTVSSREKILLAGFFFDLFFTIEFLVRLYFAIMERRVGRYLTVERGWIDFQGLVFGMGGLLNLLKVIKAIRIARILRFLRIIKIFRRIKNVSSVMAQRHVASITAISVTVVVFSLLFFTVFSPRLNLDGLETAYSESQEQIASHLEANIDDPSQFALALETLEATHSSLLIVKYRDQTLYSRHENGYYQRNFAAGDYRYLPQGELGLFFDQRPYVRQLSRDSILFFAIVVLIVLVYLLFYSPHFALTVSDPIHVMRRGLEEANYNLEVKIPEKYKTDDVFQLAELYNEKYLTLKDRTQSEEGQNLLQLDLDGVSKIFPEES